MLLASVRDGNSLAVRRKLLFMVTQIKTSFLYGTYASVITIKGGKIFSVVDAKISYGKKSKAQNLLNSTCGLQRAKPFRAIL
jgi:hypothetical protein